MKNPTGTAQDRVRPLVRVRQNRQFTDLSVASADLDAIADVARWSGSAGNGQPWRFIAVRDTGTIRRIAAVGMPSTRGLQTAPTAIAVVMPDRQEKAIQDAFDEGRVAERILIGATKLDLAAGISWVPAAARDTVGAILGVPDGWSVRTIVAIGHPSEAGLQPKNAPGAARLPRGEVVHDEKWPPAGDRR